MNDGSKARRLQKLLGNSNAQSGPSKRKPKEWNMLRHSDTVASRDLDRFDFYSAKQANVLPRSLLAQQVADDNTPPIKECIICRESDVEFSPAPPTDRCLHQPDTCDACLAQTIKVAVMTRSNCDIRCPAIGCSILLEHDDVKYVLGQDHRTFDRYNELLLQKVLQKDEGYVTCLNPACGAGQVHGGQNIFPIVTCYKCRAKTCYRHRTEWHEGYTCQEWDNREERRTKEEILSKEWVNEQTKRCPNRDCNRPIRRESGCDHMVCRPPGGCGHEFCWACLAPYGPIRSRGCEMHHPSCIHYAVGASSLQATLPMQAGEPSSSRTRWQFWRRDNNEIQVATLL